MVMKSIKYLLFLTTLSLHLISCDQSSGDANKAIDNSLSQNDNGDNRLQDKTVKFLWRDQFVSASNDTFSSIYIDEEYCKKITNLEKAALGYVATFIGNECDWDGGYTEDLSNLKCKILTALNLGYQCSEKHLGFLRNMFKNDSKVLEELKSESCPKTPETSTDQDTFDLITLTVKGNQIIVYFEATGYFMRDGMVLSWNETHHFLVENNHISLTKKEKSEVKQESMYE
jgi:hypothetical protein